DLRQDAARDFEQPEPVGLHHLAPRLAGALGDLLDAAREARVVDQHVDRAVLRLRRGEELLDARGPGDVERMAERALGDRGQAFGAARAERQAVAEASERAGAGGADAGAGAGDDDVAGDRERPAARVLRGARAGPPER